MSVRSILTHRVTRSVGVLAVLVATAVWWPTPGTSAQETPAPTEVSLTGLGGYESTALFTQIANKLIGTPQPLALGYIAHGDAAGRQGLIDGIADFAISGRPLSADDLTAMQAKGIGFISAPFSLSSATFLLAAPSFDQSSGLDGWSPPDANGDQNSSPVPSPIKIPNDVLAPTFLGDKSTNMWRVPGLLQLQGLPVDWSFDPASPPESIARSDASAMNYYIETFLAKADPAYWATATQLDGVTTSLPDEQWPFLPGRVASRQGDSAVGDLTASGQSPNLAGPTKGGVLGVVSNSISLVEQANVLAAKAKNQPYDALYPVAIQNGAGEFVAATPDNMTKAAALGDGKPMYGLNESVPGVYPLTFVDDIYVPTAGLSIDKMNAIATLMRYQAMEGQDLSVIVGEGKLPADLLAQTLAAADTVIKDNCTGTGKVLLTVDGGGPFWPSSDQGAPKKSLICSSPATTTPTTAGGSTGTGPGSESPLAQTGGVIAGPTGVLPNVSSPAIPQTGTVGGASTSSNLAGGDTEEATRVVSAKMPSSLPSDGQFEFDRLATLLLGGALFLLVRRLWLNRRSV
jgi:hypothetical protein